MEYRLGAPPREASGGWKLYGSLQEAFSGRAFGVEASKQSMKNTIPSIGNWNCFNRSGGGVVYIVFRAAETLMGLILLCRSLMDG